MDIVVETPIAETPRVAQIRGMFDLPAEKSSRRSWKAELPLAARPWLEVGLIVGPSGSGKTTIAASASSGVAGDVGVGLRHRRAAGDRQALPSMRFPKRCRSRRSRRFSPRSASGRRRRGCDRFTCCRRASSFGSIWRCCWRRRRPAGESSSTSSRASSIGPSPKSAAAALAKTGAKSRPAVRGGHVPRGRRGLAAAGLGLSACRGTLAMEVASAKAAHRSRHRSDEGIGVAALRTASLSERSARADGGLFPGDMARAAGGVFVVAAVSSTCPVRRRAASIAPVTLPDCQGVGIGNALSDFVASLWTGLGYRATSTTTHPAMIRSRLASASWRMTRKPSFAAGHDGRFRHAVTRLTAGFRYVGPSLPPVVAKVLLEDGR